MEEPSPVPNPQSRSEVRTLPQPLPVWRGVVTLAIRETTFNLSNLKYEPFTTLILQYIILPSRDWYGGRVIHISHR